MENKANTALRESRLQNDLNQISENFQRINMDDSSKGHDPEDSLNTTPNYVQYLASLNTPCVDESNLIGSNAKGTLPNSFDSKLTVGVTLPTEDHGSDSNNEENSESESESFVTAAEDLQDASDLTDNPEVFLIG